MSVIKDLLKNIKEAFNAPVIPAAPAAAADAPPAAPAGKTYKTIDGIEISIAQAGDVPAVGDAVTIAGVPAPAGVLTLEDNSTITVGDGGIITQVSEAAPITPDMSQTSPAPTLEQRIANIERALNTPKAPLAMEANKSLAEEIKAIYEKFGNGSTDERVAALELVAKALMENVFGWQIREQEQKATADAAIIAYREGLKNAELNLAKHEQTIKDLFGVIEQLSELPTADPKTLPENKRERFNKTNEKESRIERIAKALGEIKKEAATA